MKVKELFLESLKFTMIRVAIFVILSLTFQFCVNKNEYLLQLTTDNFFDEILKNNHIVLFINSGAKCEKSENLSDDLGKLAEKCNEDKNCKVAKVDCETDSEICIQYNVIKYPTLMFFKNGVEMEISDDLDLESFIDDQLEKNKGDMNESGSNYFDLAKGNHFVKFYTPWCIHSKNLVPTWNQLQQIFDGNSRVNISKVNCYVYNFVCREDYFISEYPSLLWIENGKIVDIYSGPRIYKNLLSYVEKMIQKYTDYDDNYTFTYKLQDEL